MRSAQRLLALSSLLLMLGCNKSETAGSAESDDAVPVAAPAQTAPVAGQAPPIDQAAQAPALQMQQGMQQMMQGMQQLGQGINGPGAEPVDFRTLMTQFPELSGWEKGEASGEKMNMPVAFSNAKVTYKRDRQRLEVELTDTSLHQMLLAPYSMMLSSGFERESSSGYERMVKVNDQPAFEKWDQQSRVAELTVLSGNRFVLHIKGRQLEDPQPLQALASKLNLTSLATESGAQK